MIIHYDKSNEQRKVLLQLSDCYPIDMQTLDDDTYHYYLAIDKNNGVGYGYWFVGGGADNYGIFVFVREEHRRKHLGSELLHAMEKDLVKRGAKTVFCDHEFQKASQEFMRTEGFSASAAYLMACHKIKIPVNPNQIRQARKEDFSEIMHIWTSSYRNMLRSLGHPFSEEDIEEASDESGIDDYLQTLSDRFVLETEAGIVGEGEISENHIGGVAVRIGQQNKGYGTRLTAYLTHEILSRGYSEAFLYCEEGNPAKYVYEKVGYCPTKKIGTGIKMFR